MPLTWGEAIRAAAILLAAGLAGGVAQQIFLSIVRKRRLPAEPGGVAPDPAVDAPALHARTGLRRAVLRHCSRPVSWAIPLVVVYIAVPIALPDAGPGGAVGHAFLVALILLTAWFVMGLVRAGEESVRARFRVDVRDNLEARRIHTQTEIVRKILVFLIAFLALGAVLVTFEPLREVGAGLLASAGLAGLILGFAAQRTLGNLLAGIQIAFTQPIRLDDVLIVEGEWGMVEEITLTYVVVRIWDQRRLVLPISWFIENPFQNWTRTSADILGTVFLYTDYTIPVEDVRAQLERILRESPHWDGRVWRLHVTGAGERTVELRCLMSAADSGTGWELRCEVRERMLQWLQDKHPDALPKIRAELARVPSDPLPHEERISR